MISSITNQGKLRFMIYDGALNAAIFLMFLRRLVRDTDRKLFVIVDNLRVHHAKVVVAWLAANAERIELFYLPPYAPERDPDEYVNNDVKQAMARRRTPLDKAAMKAGLTSHMRGLQRRPANVRSFFQAPDAVCGLKQRDCYVFVCLGSKSNTSKTRTHSLFRQGCMLYELIPNMPEHPLLPLTQLPHRRRKMHSRSMTYRRSGDLGSTFVEGRVEVQDRRTNEDRVPGLTF
jgi:transposase